TAVRPPMRIGAPMGTTGTVASAIAPDANAIMRMRAEVRGGPSTAMNAAVPATSRPVVAGEPSALPTRAPTTVDTFQSTYTLSAVNQNARAECPDRDSLTAIAVLSSMVTSAITKRRHPLGRNSALIRAP